MGSFAENRCIRIPAMTDIHTAIVGQKRAYTSGSGWRVRTSRAGTPSRPLSSWA